MNIRKILNFLVVIAIIGAISAVFINYYNKNKLEADDFKSSSKENSTDKKKDDESENSKVEENQEKSEDNASIEKNDEDNADDSSTEETNNESSNEVSVESTSSFKNNYVAIIGSTIILLGASTIILKSNR